MLKLLIGILAIGSLSAQASIVILKNNLEEEVFVVNEYLDYGVHFEDEENQPTGKPFPKCFKNVRSWISEFNRSNSRVVSKIKIHFAEIPEGEKIFYSQFSPKQLITRGYADVHMWEQGTQAYTTYRDISECE